jgi:hypothetical protein
MQMGAALLLRCQAEPRVGNPRLKLKKRPQALKLGPEGPSQLQMSNFNSAV